MTNGTDKAWIHSTLLPNLRVALTALLSADPVQPLILWLVIDELDLVAIPQTNARELLDALYADAETMRNLRVVLIGLDGPLPWVDPSTTQTEQLGHPDMIAPDVLLSCLAALMADRMLAPSPAELKRQVDLVNEVANLLQDLGRSSNRLARVSDALAQVWMKAARQWN